MSGASVSSSKASSGIWRIASRVLLARSLMTPDPQPETQLPEHLRLMQGAAEGVNDPLVAV